MSITTSIPVADAAPERVKQEKKRRIALNKQDLQQIEMVILGSKNLMMSASTGMPFFDGEIEQAKRLLKEYDRILPIIKKERINAHK